MTDATHRPLAEPFPTGVSWLARAIAVSTVLHLIAALAWWLTIRPSDEREVELVDIEMAPPPPKAEALPAEVAKPPSAPPPSEQLAATAPEDTEPQETTVDAGVDAPIDAPSRKKKKPDAGVDAEPMLVAELDAGTEESPTDGGDVTAMTQGSGAEGSGVPAAVEQGLGSGAPGMDNQPAVEGAPTTAGTAANLLAYFPPGHQITVMVRFDRLRKTEWATRAEQLFKPMPDYQALFGGRQIAIGDKLDMLVISTPRPRDATATTLVGRTPLSRPKMREFLTNADAPIKWSATKGGMFGARSGKMMPNDKRVLLSPWKNWFVLAPPGDFGGLTAATAGNLDSVEAKGALPSWLATIRTIEKESGDEKERGPALVLTLAGPAKRYKIPDVGLGVTSVPSPQRASLAMELVKQGWLVRGNIVFASEADATEFVTTVEDVKQRVIDSRILSGLLKKQKALNMVTGLSLSRSGARVSYATSISIADARALLTAAASTLDAYFAQPQP